MRNARRGRTKGPRMIEEIQRLRGLGLSKRMIAKALDISRNTVDRYVDAAPVDQRTTPSYKAPWSEKIDWNRVRESTVKGAPLSEYWENSGLQGVPYVSFWREYRRRHPEVPLEMHKLHPPGERLEVDYKGDAAGLGYIDRRTGDYVPCRLFGAVLCFSQLFFARATHTEKQPDLLRSIDEAYRYCGGVALTTVVDNAKAAVTRAHRYDPELNREFSHFCAHHGTAPLATRPRKPKDKNLIENHLGVFWRWAGRRVRARTCHSLGELNEFLRSLLDEFNTRVQRKYGMSRREKFEAGERSELLPLAGTSYTYAEWKTAKPHPDCHVQIGKNFYSLPHELRGCEVEVRIGDALIEIYSDLRCVARHLKAHANSTGRYITKDEHLPEAHRAMRESTPQRVVEDASAVGPQTAALVQRLIEGSRHPLMHLRRAQGILRLARRYSAKELERAAEKLVAIGIDSPRLRDIEDLIKANLDPGSASVIPITRGPNPFLRGQESFSSPAHKET